MRIAFTLGAATKASLAMLVCCGALAAGSSAAAASEPPQVPEEVADYFSSDLLPRLIDLYGLAAGGEAGIDFAEETSTIGPITRVTVWTEAFRAGLDTDLAVEPSNTWVAPIINGETTHDAEADATAADETHLGLAAVWISPYTNEPELANFVPSPHLGPAIAGAPEGSLLVHDDEHDSWYALAGDQLTLLAQDGNPVSGPPVSLRDAQETLWQELETLPAAQANNGFVVAGLTLAFVVVLLAIFVLVPDRRHGVLDPEVALGFDPASGSFKP
ncbi:MAG: hypothetical protein WED09_11085 [Homoserinimonas sp.]